LPDVSLEYIEQHAALEAFRPFHLHFDNKLPDVLLCLHAPDGEATATIAAVHVQTLTLAVHAPSVIIGVTRTAPIDAAKAADGQRATDEAPYTGGGKHKIITQLR
jgi:hypothetical protein